MEGVNNEKSFKKQQKCDLIKVKYCNKNNINLIIIPYWEFKNIKTILENVFKI